MGTELERVPEIKGWVRISVLGSGSFGTVSLWKNAVSYEHIALKRCKLHFPKEKQKDRWLKEVNFLKEIHHENIVGFKILPKDFENELNQYNPSKLPLLSMEYCNKGNLRSVLSTRQNFSGLTEVEVRNLLHDMSNALSFIHNLNIVHRDFKPENIVLQTCDYRTTNIVYKLIDLGYAKTLDSSTLSMVGTMLYVAPEVIQGDVYHISVDYWSFGVVAYEVICGFHPFLPKAPFAQRVQCLRNKSFEDICIHETETKEIVFSHRIIHNTRISPVLKSKIEELLRLAFQYDPKRRGLSRDDDVAFFDRLNVMLATKVVKVFVFPSYEFHFFEIHNHTLMSCLKVQIEEKTGINKHEQLIFNHEGRVDNRENHLIVEMLNTTEPILYMFKRNQFLDTELQKVSVLFLKKILMCKNLSKEYYSDVLNFIDKEKHKAHAFTNACTIQYIYIKNLFADATKHFDDIARQWSGLMFLIKGINHNVTITHPGKNGLEQCAIEYKNILSALSNLDKQVVRLQKRCRHAEARKSDLDRAFDELQITNFKTSASDVHDRLLKCYSKDVVVKLTTETLKMRDGILKRSKELHEYARISTVILKELTKLLLWMDNLHVCFSQMNDKIKTSSEKLLLYIHQSVPTGEQIDSLTQYDVNSLLHFNKVLHSQLNSVFIKFMCDYKNLYYSLEF